MHAQVRRLLVESGRWDAARWSAPINQHDMLATILLFSQVFLDGLRLLGLRVTRAEGDDFIHLWRVIGWLIGVDADLLPDDERDAQAWSEAILLTQGPPDDDSRALVAALLRSPAQAATTPAEHRRALARMRLSRQLSRHLLGPALAAAAAVGRDLAVDRHRRRDQPHHAAAAATTTAARAVAISTTAAAAAKPAAAEEPALQAFVSVPPTFRPMLDDDIARALAYRMEETFRRQGYQGTVGFAAHPGDIKASIPVLELTLTEWRLDLTGNVQCTFSAKLTKGKAETGLGLFMGTGIHWTHTRDRWRLAGAYEDSANDAMKDLYRKIATDKLLPGFELKRK